MPPSAVLAPLSPLPGAQAVSTACCECRVRILLPGMVFMATLCSHPPQLQHSLHPLCSHLAKVPLPRHGPALGLWWPHLSTGALGVSEQLLPGQEVSHRTFEAGRDLQNHRVQTVPDPSLCPAQGTLCHLQGWAPQTSLGNPPVPDPPSMGRFLLGAGPCCGSCHHSASLLRPSVKAAALTVLLCRRDSGGISVPDELGLLVLLRSATKRSLISFKFEIETKT